MRYLVIDLNNLAIRAVHVIKSPISDEDWIGRALTIVFHSLRRHFEKFQTDHLVICVDSWSWREELYSIYKVNRKMDPETAKPRKIAAKRISHTIIDFLEGFFREDTNVTLLRHSGVEADDFIARWVQLHTDNGQENVIMSNDSDFKQLVQTGVDLFDPLPGLLYTMEGILYQDVDSCEWLPATTRFGEKWKIKVDIGGNIVKFDPQWELFTKCIRGDTRDNIKPAFPKVSEIKMREAFEDRGGPKWNNLINSTWGRPEPINSVRQLFELNKNLIDLSAQPEIIIELMDEQIHVETTKRPRQMVNLSFERMCKYFNLTSLLEARSNILPCLSNPYKGSLV